MEKILWITNPDISVHVVPLFLPHSAWEREKTIEILTKLQKEETRKIICIDWTAATSNIKIITDNNFDEASILLPKWIDWVIFNTSEKAKLILPVADCAPIVAYHKTWDICGSFHAGYKWVAWENASDLGIITNMIEELKNVSNSDNLDDFEFYIWPMIWREFELPKSYVEPMFSRIFKEYNLNPNKYFLKHKTDNTKIYLHLRLLIRDILERLWKKIRLKTHLKNEWSFFDNWITDKWNSEYPSHRLYTQFWINDEEIKKLSKKFSNYDLYLQDILETKAKIKEIKRIMRSKNFEQYKKDYRLATILEN